MITPDGYSKDPNIIPEGIVMTWGKDLIEEKGGLLAFIRHFEKEMASQDGLWLQKCKNKPKNDGRLLYVYVIVCNQLKYRLYYGGYETGSVQITNGNGVSWSARSVVSWPRVLMVGPFTKAPRKIKLSGFQGFRYCTKLF